MKISNVLGVLLLAATVAGCSKDADQAASTAAASNKPAASTAKESADTPQSTVAQFYEYRSKGDYAAAYDMTSEGYRGYYDRQAWIAAMRDFEEAAGGFKRADVKSWSPTDKIAVEYGNLTANERVVVSDTGPYRITGLAITAQDAASDDGQGGQGESRGERITDPATEMTFNGVVESISNNRPKDLLNRMEYEKRFGNRTPWHLLAGPREMTLLHFAALQGAADSAAELIRLGTPVDVLAEHDSTPLFLAACAGRMETVKLLASHGANVGRLNDQGFKPQDCAKAQGKLEVASWLEAQSGGIAKSPFEPLRRLEAAAGTKYDELCLAVSKTIRSAPNDQQTISQAKMLIDGGFFSQGDSCFVIEEGPPDSAVHQMNAAIRGERGRGKVMGSILAIAAAVGSTEIVRHAVEHGFDPSGGFYSYTTLNGQHGSGPAILLATQNGHADVVQLLIDKGADVNAIDSGSMRHLLDYAEDPEIRRMLAVAARTQLEKSR
ncbi:ankyrin repeat protein [Tahibacter aquaticus]|uniref:Ankyrin repeat protein n=1 Tax=Tahibacter aquaticus TaxID=520092 RepID=A0A4R6YMJ1_9GAMM|nr:ankyrin repeat domain-containing protein [Tahibacter aquaticus]TDR38674.1 ankyrin repeat protein [Tahibacter aquaticus]